MKLKESQELQFKLKIYIIFFCFYSFHTYSQTKPKKLNIAITSGLNYNDINLGDIKITDRIFSNAKSKLSYNVGGLLSYKFEKILSFEIGAYYAEQEMYLSKLLLFKRTNAFFYIDKLYSVQGEAYFVNGNIRATSIIIPARLKLILTPKTEKKLGLILGFHRQDNYKYNEYGEYLAEIKNIEKDYPYLGKEAITYLEDRFIKDENLETENHTKFHKTNNLGFLLGLNLDIKNLTIEINKHFNEVRPDNGPVYNYNFSSLNLRYWF